MAQTLTVSFQLGQTLGTTSQVTGDLAEPVSVVYQGRRVEIAFEWRSDPSDLTVEADADTTLWLSGFSVRTELADDGREAQSEAASLLMDVGRAVTDTLRVAQPTTGLAGVYPPVLRATIDVKGQSRPYSGDSLSEFRKTATVVYVGSQRVGRGALAAALAAPRPDHDLDVLLAQARHFAMYNPDSNVSLAVVLSALVCEVKIKRALRAVVRPEHKPALDLILPERTQARATVPQLYAEYSKAFWGRSYAEDDPKGHDLMIKLFRKRNDFAHAAGQVTNEDATRATSAAVRAVMWTDEGLDGVTWSTG